jgi:sortase B
LFDQPPATESQAEPRLDISQLSEINPDFVGWISIEGTSLSYPVVQGNNNVRYLNTTFGGGRNPAGAIFLDYHAAHGFDTPIAVLYGHNMRNDTMFSPLIEYLDPEFLRDHPEILIMTAAGETLSYQVFYARQAGMRDSIYTLDFNDSNIAVAFFNTAPPETSRFLVLSTCHPYNRDSRILVYAALVI